MTQNPTSPSHGIYPVPVEEDFGHGLRCDTQRQAGATQRARVSSHPINKVWPGRQRPKDQTEIASFASWDMTEPVEVSVVSHRPIHDVRVRPSSSGIQPQVEGDTIRFSITKPGQYTVEVNGTHHALHLFANPPEEKVPDPKDTAVHYFGPRAHRPIIIRLESNETLYIAAGAVSNQ
jgi:hypothetical protein